MNIVWTLFEKLARKHENFDLLKQFNNFKDSMIQTVIMQNSYEGMTDPDIFYKETFGKFAPLITNISSLVSKVSLSKEDSEEGFDGLFRLQR
jgi:hypothetical protein